jgi:hypothetical protein
MCLPPTDNTGQWRLQSDRADRLRDLADDGRVVGANGMTEVDLIERDEDVFGRADEGVHRPASHIAASSRSRPTAASMRLIVTAEGRGLRSLNFPIMAWFLSEERDCRAWPGG